MAQPDPPISVKVIPKGFQIRLTKELVKEFGLRVGDVLVFYNEKGRIVVVVNHKPKLMGSSTGNP